MEIAERQRNGASAAGSDIPGAGAGARRLILCDMRHVLVVLYWIDLIYNLKYRR